MNSVSYRFIIIHSFQLSRPLPIQYCQFNSIMSLIQFNLQNRVSGKLKVHKVNNVQIALDLLNEYKVSSSNSVILRLTFVVSNL